MIKPDKELILISLPCASSLVFRSIFSFFLRTQLPASLVFLAALTPSAYKITFINQRVFWRKGDFRPKALVAITCLSSNAQSAYGLAERYRKAGSTVIMGGVHVSARPEEALEHCDSVVVGYADAVWKQLVEDHEKGALQKIYRGHPVEDFLTPVYPYLLKQPASVLRPMFLMLTRGCRYRCDFCLSDGRSQHARIEQVVELARRSRSFLPTHFADNNIYNDPERSKEFFRKLIPLKIRWFSQATIDIAFDDEALRLAAQSGCCGLLIGIETMQFGSYPKNSAGSIRTEADYFQALRRIRAHGIGIVGSFIVGLDSDTHRDYGKMLWFIVKSTVICQFMWVTMYTCIPYPGAVLYERLKREGRLIRHDLGKSFLPFFVYYRPRHMSTAGLTLWFFVLRIVSLACSTTGLLLVFSVVMAFHIDHMVLARFGNWGVFLHEIANFSRGLFGSLRALQG
jgi:radical SAM superfamily enzyme YgiQ (UPF0313 family)